MTGFCISREEKGIEIGGDDSYAAIWVNLIILKSGQAKCLWKYKAF